MVGCYYQNEWRNHLYKHEFLMNQWRPVWNQFDHLLETVHNEHEYRFYLNWSFKTFSPRITPLLPILNLECLSSDPLWICTLFSDWILNGYLKRLSNFRSIDQSYLITTEDFTCHQSIFQNDWRPKNNMIFKYWDRTSTSLQKNRKSLRLRCE